MAKITIAGDAVVITSAMTLDEIRTIEKYRPSALVLKSGEDGKEPIFRIGITAGNGHIGEYGIEFASETHNNEKRATATFICSSGEGDIKEVIADAIGSAIGNLNKLEASLPDVIAEITAERAAIISSISVAQ